MVTDGPGDVITGRGEAVGERLLGGTGVWAAEHRAAGWMRARRGDAPNHDNFSSPQLHC